MSVILMQTVVRRRYSSAPAKCGLTSRGKLAKSKKEMSAYANNVNPALFSMTALLLS
jgi:hypothetical protein